MKRRHPILWQPRDLGLYLAVLASSAVLLAALATGGTAGVPWSRAVGLGVPLGLAHAALCLPLWWIYRAIPLKPSAIPRLVFTHGALGLLSAQLLILAGKGLSRFFGALVDGRADPFQNDQSQWWIVGILLYLLAAAFHYLSPLVASSRLAENRALAFQARSREAQLKALEAQVNPHFLFNSLHSLSALCGFDPAGARRMAILLAGFFRGRVEAGRRDWLPLSDEIGLVEKYLEIEKVRFENRLAVELRVDDEARDCHAPPFLLQPLVENAVKHGIASLVEGGTVGLDARSVEGRLEISVSNPCDPDRPRARGTRTGLANVKGRLLTLFGPQARFEIAETANAFRVTLSFPALVDMSEDKGLEEKDHG